MFGTKLQILCLAVAGLLAAAPVAVAGELEMLMGQVSSAKSPEERTAALDKMQNASSVTVETLEAFLKRTRKSTDDQRRALLRSAGADVPDKQGRFQKPGRRTEEQREKEDGFDWLTALAKATPQPGLDEVIADVVAIRVLAGRKDARAGTAILDFAFAPEGMAYRDECGRRLRVMSPYSLPALIRSANVRKKYSARKDYAQYQLERLDRENPGKALQSASTDTSLQLEVFRALGDVLPRWGVPEVFKYLDHDTKEVREAARRTWMQYVDGPAPPEPPKQRLKEVGGKLSAKPMPLWRDYRVLARVQLQKTLKPIWKENPPAKTPQSLVGMTEALFAYYDGRREQKMAAAIATALAASSDADLEKATVVLGKVFLDHPDHEKKAEIATIFARYAEVLEKRQDWKRAGDHYQKAHEIDPKAKNAKARLAKSYFAYGKGVESSGGDPSAVFAKASSIEPNFRNAQEDKNAGTASKAAGGEAGKKSWLLLLGIAGAVVAAVLLTVGLVRRRSRV